MLLLMIFVFKRIDLIGHASTSLNQAYTSPKEDCPASHPKRPGIIDPFTCPQIPAIKVSSFSFGPTAISQQLVPRTFTKTPSFI